MANQQGILELLSSLNDEDLYALTKTVTQGLLKTENREEAIAGILKYSPGVVSILRRKVLTREILFEYLDERNITIKLPATKNDIIDTIVEYWKKENQVSCIPEVFQHKNSKSSEGNIEQLATEFAKWFYQQLNTEGVESEHFFADAKLKINLISNNECNSSLVDDDPQEISDVLRKTKFQHNLFFNPNFTEDGVQGRIDPHGLVMVMVCGTLHVQDKVAGVFEQVFALARDPFSDNNWKVKHTELVLRSKSDVINQPRLCDSDLTSDLLALPLK